MGMPEQYSCAMTADHHKFMQVWKCAMRFLAVIVAVIALAFGVPPISAAQMANPLSPGFPPPPADGRFRRDKTCCKDR